jgi:capsular polysaccharide biosynthesis protein
MSPPGLGGRVVATAVWKDSNLHDAGSVALSKVRGEVWRRVVAPVRRRIGLDPVRSRTGFSRLLATAIIHNLATVDAPVVTLISDRPGKKTAQVIRSIRPQARLHRFAAGLSNADLHLGIAAVGVCDLIIDETFDNDRIARARNLLFHLRPGGVLLLRRGSERQRASETPKRRRKRRRQLFELLADIGAGLADKDATPEGQEATERANRRDQSSEADRARFGRAVRALQVRSGHLLLVNGRRAQAKIREEQINKLLGQRPDLGKVFEVRPGADWAARGQLQMNEPDRHVRPIPRQWSAPPVSVREYYDAVTAPGQVVTQGSLILPETYRHLHNARLRNRYAGEVSALFGDTTQAPRFAQEPPAEGPRYLPGSYFHLDDEFRGHFGHMTTEVISRLWGWRRAKELDPDLRAIMHFNKRRDLADWEVQLLTAAGIPQEDIVFTYDSVRVERLVAATPMFSNPGYAHPCIQSVWQEIGDNLAQRSSVAVPDGIFIARRITKRACRNADAVQQFFTELGFTPIYPEDYPLGDQVRIFRETRAIAGFAGSGMFTSMFSAAPKPVILVASESYTGRNEALISGVLGHQLSIAWCRSEFLRGSRKNQRSERKAARHAGFTFDFEREGEFIRQIVADLHD